MDLSYIEFVELLGLVYLCCSPNLGSYHLLFLQTIYFFSISLISLSLPSPIMCTLLHLIVSHKSLRLCSLFFLLLRLHYFKQPIFEFMDFFSSACSSLPLNPSSAIFNSYVLFFNSRMSHFKKKKYLVSLLIFSFCLYYCFPHFILFSFSSWSIFMTVF